MFLATGTRLGAYEVQTLIGSGGMGQVYRARDTKLNRDVAIKVVSDTFAHAGDGLTRFNREAQALAALNHPNIAQIYGLDTQSIDDRPVAFIAMECVDGEELAQRIARGPVPLDEALAIARQVAEALEAAHEHGIIHRDLKPANIKVRPDGSVKVLDFGLAKAIEPLAHGPGATMSPTVSVHATEAGIILGTAAYMAPEQARGQVADKRADIWAFGAVLFELLCGKRAFEGASVSDTLAAVLRSDPEWSALPRIPPAVRRLLERCLERDPRQRLRDIGEARIALTADIHRSAQVAEAESPGTARSRLRTLILMAAGAIVGAGAAALMWYVKSPSVGSSVARFLVERPPNAAAAESIAVSPDGRWLAFTSSPGARVGTSSRGGIWIRALDEVVATELPDTADATTLFWSPDSAFLGFFAGGKVKKIAIGGGPAADLCEIPLAAKGGTWSADGVIVFATAEGIFKVPSAGGTAAPLVLPDPSRHIDYRWPAFLPDNRHFLYLARSVTEELAIYIGAIDDPTPRFVTSASSNAIYAAPGYLLFIRDRALYAQAFNLGTLAVSGEPMLVIEGLDLGVAQAFLGSFSSSSNGVLAYGTVPSPNQQFAWYARDGTESGRLPITGQFEDFAISPDGQRVAVRKILPGNADLWVFDLEHATQSRLTFNPEPEGAPVWSQDGQWVMYYSARTRPFGLYRRRSTGAGDEQAIGQPALDAGNRRPTDWSRDGRQLLFTQVNRSTRNDVWVLRVNEKEPPVPVLHSRFNEEEARFSPDAKWIAYVSDETGRREVYVQTFPTSDQRYQISSSGGTNPKWRQDGRELFYKSGDGKVVIVSVSTAPAFEHRRSPVTITLPPDAAFYDVAPDGQRVLVLGSASGSQVGSPFTVVLNWTAALKK